MTTTTATAAPALAGTPVNLAYKGLRTEKDVVTELRDAIVALNAPEPMLFRSGSQVVFLQWGRITTVGAGALISVAAKLGLKPYVMQTETDEDGVTRKPVMKVKLLPEKYARLLLDNERWFNELPELKATVDRPVFRPDGTCVTRKGYDPETRLYLTEEWPYSVPAAPTPEEVARARSFVLDDLLGDFELRDDASLAAAVAAMVSSVTVFMHGDPLPLLIHDATNPGSGKNTLARLVGVAWGGTHVGEIPGDNDEMRKRILAELASEAGSVLMDEARKEVNYGSLNTLLTSRAYSDRELGSSRTLTFENGKLWQVAGNNVTISRDLTRRSLLCMHDPKGDPTKREATRFRHTDVVAYAEKWRAHLITCLLTLVADWAAAGAPRSGHTFASYQDWAQLTGGVLERMGVAGFLGNRETINAAHAGGAEDGAFVEALARAFGTGTFTAVDAVKGDGTVGGEALVRELADHLPDQVQTTAAKRGNVVMSMGRWLAKHKGTYVQGATHRLVMADDKARPPLYRVEAV